MDVTAELEIERPAEAIAAYATDPANDALWVTGIQEAELLTPLPIGMGSRVRRVASFMGKRIDYVMEVVGWEPGRRMDLHAVEAPMPMDVTYAFEPVSANRTRAGIRVRGDAGGMYRIAGPLMSRRVKKSISNDLANLKRIMESERATD